MLEIKVNGRDAQMEIKSQSRADMLDSLDVAFQTVVDTIYDTLDHVANEMKLNETEIVEMNRYYRDTMISYIEKPKHGDDTKITRIETNLTKLVTGKDELDEDDIPRF